MTEQLRLLLGTARLRALVLLLALTGLTSLVLNAFDADAMPWVTSAQMLLALSVPVCALAILVSSLEPAARVRWLVILLPVAGALLLGLTGEPRLLLPLAGVALGWTLAGIFLFRPRQPQLAQQAIKALRRGQYEDALAAMDALLLTESEVAAHYRLRAEILRLAGDLARARDNYRQMTRLTPQDASAWNGLAEVLLQAGQHQEALDAGLRALALAPEDWVAFYNLGMVEDRLRLPLEASVHLREALSRRVPDARHRLLLRLYLMRAQVRLDDRAEAQQTRQQLRGERSGLQEWQRLLVHEQAAPLRKVLAEDIQLAQALMDEDAPLELLLP